CWRAWPCRPPGLPSFPTRRSSDLVGVGVEDRRIAIGGGEGLGHGALGEGGDLGEDALGGVGVEVAELAGIEFLVDAQDLEHVELEVSDVALVMTHDGLLRSTGRCRCSCRDAGPCWSRATATYSSVTRRMLVRCHPTVQGEEAF